jgi:sulfite exporter TauE/SafE
MMIVGRVILTLALIGTIVGPVMADWNESHVFNERWPSHARFHGVVSIGMAVLMSLFGLWQLWAAGAVAVAAAVPIAYWGSFFIALLVPGTGVDDPPHRVPRPAGLPINVWVPIVVVVLVAIGWLLAR